MLKKITKEEARIRVLPVDSDISQYDNMYDQPQFSEIVNEMIEENGLWGWCDVEVKASWRDFEGHAYLGACSYKDKEDFVSISGYYEDLVEEALEDLNEKIAECFKDLQELQK